jgi:hypothetical protein
MKPVFTVPVVCALLMMPFSGMVFADVNADFETVFGEKIRKVTATSDKADDIALAGEIFEVAARVGDAPALRKLMHERTLDLACRDASGYAIAEKAVAVLVQADPENAVAWQEKSLDVHRLRYQRSRGREKIDAGVQYKDRLLIVGQAKLEAVKAGEALALFRQAESVARALRDPGLPDIAALVKTATSSLNTERRILSLTKSLERDPADTKARDELVLLYLLDLDDPSKANGLLREDSREDLRKYVPLAAGPVDAVEEGACLELAAWYDGQYRKPPSTPAKATACGRAVAYYGRYLALHEAGDLKRLKAKVRFQQLEKELARLDPAGRRAAVSGGTIAPHRLLAMLDTDVTGHPWRVDGKQIVGRAGSIDAESGRILMKEPFQARSFAFGFRILAKQYRVILVMIDGQKYMYSRGHWHNTGGFILTPDGPERHRGTETIPDASKWGKMDAKLANDQLVLYYNDEVAARCPVKTSRGQPHTIRVGFGSHEVTVAVRDVYLRKR